MVGTILRRTAPDLTMCVMLLIICVGKAGGTTLGLSKPFSVAERYVVTVRSDRVSIAFWQSKGRRLGRAWSVGQQAAFRLLSGAFTDIRGRCEWLGGEEVKE